MITKDQKKTQALTGGYAVGEAMRQINPEVMAVYPITPQTPIVQYFAKQEANGKVDTEIIPVESEHSAMSACVGSAAAGARTMTASASQGVMYMMEMLPVASSMRLPIVMAVANRAISGPINIHGDHSDAMAMRDTGWVQLFSENAQEAYDNTLMALKVAEQAQLPATVNLDGFITSHSVENVETLADSTVEKFVGEYQAPDKNLLNFEKPVTFGPIALPDSYFEFRKQTYDAFLKVPKIFQKVAGEFEKISGRKYEAVERYKTRGAEKVIVAMNSTCGTIKEAVDRLRKRGQKVGLLKIRLFRPFPDQEVKKALKNTQEVIVMDRNLAFGTGQVLAGEVERSIGRKVKSVVYGLGGRDVYEKDVERIFAGKVKDFLQ
jgi:pyruvate ferredoxin oxidoreductase alpha subunit